jgi:hypothetical protein
MRSLLILLAVAAMAAQPPVPYHYAETASGQPPGPATRRCRTWPRPVPQPAPRGAADTRWAASRPTRDGAQIGHPPYVVCGRFRLRLPFKLTLNPPETPAAVEVGLAARPGALYRARGTPEPCAQVKLR